MGEVQHPLRFDDRLGGSGSVRTLRFLAQVTAVLEPGCGPGEASKGKGGEAQLAPADLVHAYPAVTPGRRMALAGRYL